MKFVLAFSLVALVADAKSYLQKAPDSQPGARLIGGQTAQAAQFPYMAAIYTTKPDGRFFCAGSVFKEQWILTAAQCVINGTQFDIQLGSNLLTGDDSNRLSLTSTTAFMEPRFNPEVNMWHDIALIKLDSPLTFNDYIQPVNMLESMNPIYHGVPCQNPGWGQTSDTGDIVNELNYVDMIALAQEECEVYYGEQLLGSNCCATGASNQGPCFGDMGSPLMTTAPVGNFSIQVAIASFLSGNGCESTDPSGYVRTDAYYGWLLETVDNNTFL